MAATAIGRVQGHVLGVVKRNGTARRSGEPFSMTIVTILVAERGITEVVLPRDWTYPEPRHGDELDLLIEFGNGASGQLRTTILEVFTPATV